MVRRDCRREREAVAQAESMDSREALPNLTMFRSSLLSECVYWRESWYAFRARMAITKNCKDEPRECGGRCVFGCDRRNESES